MAILEKLRLQYGKNAKLVILPKEETEVEKLKENSLIKITEEGV